MTNAVIRHHGEALAFHVKGNARKSAYDAWGSSVISNPEQVTERPCEAAGGPTPDDA